MARLRPANCMMFTWIRENLSIVLVQYRLNYCKDIVPARNLNSLKKGKSLRSKAHFKSLLKLTSKLSFFSLASANTDASVAYRNTTGIVTSSVPSPDIANNGWSRIDESRSLSKTITPTAPAACARRAFSTNVQSPRCTTAMRPLIASPFFSAEGILKKTLGYADAMSVNDCWFS